MSKEELEQLDRQELIQIIIMLQEYKELADFHVKTLKELLAIVDKLNPEY